MVRASAADSALAVHERKRVRERGWVGGGLLGIGPEHLHAEARERVSNDIVSARYVLCRNVEIMLCSEEEEETEERHNVWAARGA